MYNRMLLDIIQRYNIMLTNFYGLNDERKFTNNIEISQHYISFLVF